MNIHSLRYVVGCIVLLGHFGAAALFIWKVGQTTRPDEWDYLGGLAAIIPFTLLYASVFYRYVVSNPTASQDAIDARVDVAPFVIQVGMVLMFMAGLIGAMYWAFANNIDASRIPVILGGVDSLFAVFVSMTFSTLFPLEWESAKAKNAGSPTAPDQATN